MRLHNLSNYLVEDEDPDTSLAGASLIAGIGFVAGLRCMIWVDDSGIAAGAATEMTMPTAVSILEMAKKQKLPLLHLVESAGADLTRFKVESWSGFGGVFKHLANLSAAGIPVISVLHGASTAGGAYMPGMSDYVIGVKKNGLAALAGAALVKAATGEHANDRELGGSEMHASASGLVEYLAEDDAQAIAWLRDLMLRLNWSAHSDQPHRLAYDAPKYDTDELAGVVPADYRVPYEVREVLARLVDGSAFEDFKPAFGVSTVCVQSQIMGFPCGLIGNNGPIDPQGAAKATQFYQLCDQAQMPIIFLHNTTGYMVGTQVEQQGMIKLGAKMIQAVSNIRVPKITLFIGASYGAGSYGMCGTAYEPDFMFSWPSATSNVMGGEQAGKTMSQVAIAGARRKGLEPDLEAIQAREAKIISHFKRQESAFYTSGRNLDHGVIDPRDSRKVLGFVLETCLQARLRKLQPNSFGVARI